MTNKIVYSPKALEDLDDIWEYISNDFENVDVANNVVDKILEEIVDLKDYPKLGPELIFEDNINSGYRFLICKPYIAFYHLGDSNVMIDRVLHEKRDYIQIIRNL